MSDVQRLTDRLEALATTVSLARVLVKAGRPVDLGGLDIEIGGLCAGIIDLELEHRGCFRQQLVDFLLRLEELTESLIGSKCP